MIACMCTSASLFLTHSQLTWYISDIVPIIVILILLADIFWYSDIVWYFDILLYSFWYILLLWYSLIYFAIVNSLLYVLSVGLPTYNTPDRYQPSSSIHVALLPSARPVLRSKVLKPPSWLPMAPFFLLLSLSKFFIVMLPLCELQKPSSSSENSLRKMPPDG